MLRISEDKVTPFRSKCRVCAGKGDVVSHTIGPELLVIALKGGAKASAGVQVDGGFAGPEAEAEFAEEFLVAGPEAGHHRGVDVGWELIYRLHGKAFRRLEVGEFQLELVEHSERDGIVVQVDGADAV